MHFPSVAELCPEPSALGLSLDLQGWNSTDPAFAKLISSVCPRVVIEVGSWKGASTVHMAKLLFMECHVWQLYAVDTWLGGGDHYVNQDKPENNLMRDPYGYPRIYHQFLYNIATELHPLARSDDNVFPIVQTSVSAARILGRAKIDADLIYIDASHVYQDVYADLEHFTCLLRPGGVIFGDDWHDFPGVRLAVTRFAYETGMGFVQEGAGWQLRRPE